MLLLLHLYRWLFSRSSILVCILSLTFLLLVAFILCYSINIHTHLLTRWRSIFFHFFGAARKCYRIKISKRLYFLCTCGPIEIVSFKKKSLNDNRSVQSQSHSRCTFFSLFLSRWYVICCWCWLLCFSIRSVSLRAFACIHVSLVFAIFFFTSMLVIVALLENDKWIASYENRPTAHFISTLSMSRAVTARKSTLTFSPFFFAF